MSIHLAKPEHEVAYQDVCALIANHAGKLTPLEILAVAANLVGKLVGMQDQHITTPEVAMEVVAQNIEHGNKLLLERLADTQGAA